MKVDIIQIGSSTYGIYLPPIGLHVQDENGKDLNFDTIYDARRRCEKEGYEIQRLIVDRKSLHMEQSIEDLPQLEKHIEQSERSAALLKQELDILLQLISTKRDTLKDMIKALNYAKDDHEELRRMKDDTGI